MLTRTARGALNVTDWATGQENVLPPGIAHEALIAEPLSPQDIHTAPTDPLSEPTVNPVQSSNVFDDEVADIAQVHCDSELFEFELSTSSPSVNVKGNLRRNFDFWKRIGTPSFILNVIDRGYLLPFISFPEPAVFKNNRSSLSHADFVEGAIRDLVETGRVLHTKVPPRVVNPLSVSVQPNGKKRLILDLRYVNKFLRKMHVKYEDWKTAMSYFARGAYMFSFDLKSGYHHVEIFEGHQTYLGFSWKHSNSNQVKFYVFTVLPFGLSSAPHVFTKILKPLEKHWRYQGICLAVFLDDGWGIEKDSEVCGVVANAVRADLFKAGFVTNEDKSVWIPCQRLDWLGITWDSARGTIEIVDRRVVKITNTIDSIIASDFVLSARRLASFTGQIISTAPVSGNISRIMTRHCIMSTLSAQHWDSEVKMDSYCIEELYFWKNNLNSIKVRDCFLFNKPQRFVYSDASATGCGSVITLNEDCVCHKLWEPSECSMSSTWRELAAIVFALESFVPILEGSLVKWFTDSQTAARIIEVGSMKLDLHRLAIKIFQFCAEHSIRLEVQWIPRTENEKADYISRLVDFDDWQITHDLFQSLEQLWGPHTVDCFANYYTAKLPRFFSRFWNPGASGIDFFAQDLSSENCLVVPPVTLVARVIHYLSLQKAMATLVVPLWPSSSFWPLLTSKYRSFIKGCFRLNASQALALGRNLSSFLGSPRFTGEIVALRFEFL